jgi:hypothetical protein
MVLTIAVPRAGGETERFLTMETMIYREGK